MKHNPARGRHEIQQALTVRPDQVLSTTELTFRDGFKRGRTQETGIMNREVQTDFFALQVNINCN
jgi:hypothetical protein